MKRSGKAKLVLMASTLIVTGCEPTVPMTGYNKVDDCYQQDARVNCDQYYEQAKMRHSYLAPTYQNISDCQLDFGVGQCEQNGGAAIPIMDGFAASPDKYTPAQPLYMPLGSPHLHTADNAHTFGNRQTIHRPASQLQAQRGQHFSGSSKVSRGGFGSTAARNSSFSFGG